MVFINGNMLNIKRFSSGELKLIKDDLNKYIVNNKVELLFNCNISMFELQILVDYYISNNVKVDLILSYLPYQRMDHKDGFEVETIKSVANIINKMGLNRLTICEPHCDIKYFNNSKKYSFIENLKEKVKKDINFTQNDCVVFTDFGGYNRYSDIFDKKAYFKKVRDKNTGLIVEHQIVGEITKVKKALIIDDIISTGDTIVNVIKALKERGVDQIYIFSGHIENNKYNNRIYDFDCVKMVYSTNSLKKKSNNKKLKLYKVEDLFYENGRC